MLQLEPLYGVFPLVMISDNSIPNDQTSLLVENWHCSRASMAVHFIGTRMLLEAVYKDSCKEKDPVSQVLNIKNQGQNHLLR